jgi:hypothetical protein
MEPALTDGMQQGYEGAYMPARPRRRLAFVGIGAVLLIAALLYASGKSGGFEERAQDVTGTSGRVAELPSGEGTSAVPAAAVINELETITGVVDGHELIGRRVDLHVDLGEASANANASGRFWIGPADSPLLVVLARDNRNELQRVEGEPPPTEIPQVRAGQPVNISGRIEKLPRAEERYNWGLTRNELRLLSERPIYIRAESVRGSG